MVSFDGDSSALWLCAAPAPLLVLLEMLVQKHGVRTRCLSLTKNLEDSDSWCLRKRGMAKFIDMNDFSQYQRSHTYL